MSYLKMAFDMLLKKTSSQIPKTPVFSPPPEASKEITYVVRKVTSRLFSEHYNGIKESIRNYSLIAKSGESHNGDIIREAYHQALTSSESRISELEQRFATLEEQHGSSIPAFIAHQIREQTRIAAWQKMKPEDVERLYKRNLAVHGRKEGPAFETVVMKLTEKFPGQPITEILTKVREKVTTTSKDYDARFGVTDVAIHVHPGGIVESTAQRKERLLGTSTTDVIDEAQKHSI